MLDAVFEAAEPDPEALEQPGEERAQLRLDFATSRTGRSLFADAFLC